MPTTRRAISTRTTPARSWNCTPWASAPATRQADVEALARILTGVGIDLQAGGSQTQAGAAERSCVREGAVRVQSGPARLWRQGLPRPHHQGPRARRSRRGASISWSRHPATATPSRRRQIAIVFRVGQSAGGAGAADGADLQDHRRRHRRRARHHGPRAGVRGLAEAGAKFKDPVQYVFSAVRLAYDDKVILNTLPIQGWLEPAWARACSITRRRMAMR